MTPSHQFPTGATLPAVRRVELLDWANRVGAYVVEDDYDSDFRFDGPPLTALAGVDNSASVIYLGTFSKSIGAGLRIGYIVVPMELAETAVTVKPYSMLAIAGLTRPFSPILSRTGHLRAISIRCA